MKKLLKDKYFYVLLLFMIIITVGIFSDFILQKRLYIYFDIGGDTRQSYWPMYKYILDSLKNGTLRTWSFQMGLGTSTFSLYSFLFDPFIIILLLFPIKYLTYGILIASLVKIFISGILFYIYINLFTIKRFPSVISSLIWAFNGFIMLWGQHYWFATMIVLFTFVILALELWILGKRTYLFSISIALMAINSPYFLYMISIFIFFYVLFRFLWMEKEIKLKTVFIKIVRFFGAYFIGLGAGAVVFLPVAYLILTSPRTSGSLFNGHIFYLATFKEYVSIFFRLFSNNTLGIGLQYFGSINYYEGPLLCSSLIWVIAFPQLIFKKLNLKNKIIHFIVILFGLAAFIYPFFSLIFNALSAFNYRWNFLIVFLNVLTIAYILNSLSKTKNISYLGLFISFLIVVIGWYFCYKTMVLHQMIPSIYLQSHYLQKLALIIGIFLVTYSIIFMFLHRNNQVIWLILLCLVTVELIAFNYPTVNQRLTVPNDISKKKEGYYDYTNEALSYIKNKDNSLFRVDKNFLSYSFDDALFQNYNGVQSYNSLNNPNYFAFIKELIPASDDIKLIGGLDQRSILRDLTGVKYLLSKNDVVPGEYKKLKTFGDVHLYKNPYSLPIGFTYDSYITENEFKKLMPFEKEAAMLNSVVVKNNLKLNKYRIPKSEPGRGINLKSMTLRNASISTPNKKSDFEISSKTGDPGFIISLPKTNKGWKIEFEIQGPEKTTGQLFWSKKGKDFNSADSIIFNVSDKPIEFAYEINVKQISQLRLDPGDAPGVYKIKNFKIVQADDSKYQNIINKYKQNSLKIDEYTNSYIKGRINVSRKQMLFMSIPYDRGWILKIDGQVVKTQQVNIGFIGAQIPKGYHTIELEYRQPFLVIGIVITLLSWFVIMLKIVLNKKKQKQRRPVTL